MHPQTNNVHEEAPRSKSGTRHYLTCLDSPGNEINLRANDRAIQIQRIQITNNVIKYNYHLIL